MLKLLKRFLHFYLTEFLDAGGVRRGLVLASEMVCWVTTWWNGKQKWMTLTGLDSILAGVNPGALCPSLAWAVSACCGLSMPEMHLAAWGYFHG